MALYSRAHPLASCRNPSVTAGFSVQTGFADVPILLCCNYDCLGVGVSRPRGI